MSKKHKLNFIIILGGERNKFQVTMTAQNVPLQIEFQPLSAFSLNYAAYTFGAFILSYGVSLN